MRIDKHGGFKAGVFALVVGLVVVWPLYQLMGIGALLLALPLIAFGASRLIVELIHGGFTWASDQQLEQWEGKYYEFATVQVRIYEYEDELWLSVADIAQSTGLRINADSQLSIYPSGCQVLPGTGNRVCMTAPTVEKFIAKHPGQETGRFLLWLQREVMMPWERKKIGQLAHR
jgi:hypothetical protein